MSSLPSTDPAVAALNALRTRAAEGARLRSGTAWALACLPVDAFMLLAMVAATLVGTRGSSVPVMSLPWLLCFACLVLALSWVRGMYKPRLRLELVDDLRGLVAVTSLAAMVVLSMRVLLTDAAVDAAEILRPWAFATAYIAAGRAALNWSQLAARREGESLKPTLIVGAGRIGRLTAARLLQSPEYGLQPIGFLDKEPLDDAKELGLPVLGSSWDLERVVQKYGVQQVIMTFSTAPHGVLLRVVERCEALGVEVSLVPRLFEKMTERLQIDHLGGLPLISARRPNPKGWQFAVKYAADRAIAAVLIVLLLPLLAVTALTVYLSLGRPILFRQARVGRDGREFIMLKFRTMQGGPEDGGEADAEWALTESNGDAKMDVSVSDRSTPLGKVLRRLSIDELPQLLNVLWGHMSLVGPRPERTHYVHLFQDSVYRYADRHRVKSGITGWAQVNGLRGKTSLADRVEWDNYYIENWSLWLDVKILIFTALSVVKMGRQAQ
jgi:exopolysaccharide biosynthesis polyprenyl glycosylphosphotransferase